jgi:hypothetical protein
MGALLSQNPEKSYRPSQPRLSTLSRVSIPIQGCPNPIVSHQQGQSIMMDLPIPLGRGWRDPDGQETCPESLGQAAQSWHWTQRALLWPHLARWLYCRESQAEMGTGADSQHLHTPPKRSLCPSSPQLGRTWATTPWDHSLSQLFSLLQIKSLLCWIGR